MSHDPIREWLESCSTAARDTPPFADADLRHLSELVEADLRFALALARKDAARHPILEAAGLGVRDLADSIRRRAAFLAEPAGQTARLAVLELALLALANAPEAALPTPLEELNGPSTLGAGPLDALLTRVRDGLTPKGAEFTLTTDELWSLLRSALAELPGASTRSSAEARLTKQLAGAAASDLAARHESDRPSAACRLLLAVCSRPESVRDSLRSDFPDGGVMTEAAWSWFVARVAAHDTAAITEEWTSIPRDLHTDPRVREALRELRLEFPHGAAARVDRLARSRDRWERLTLRLETRSDELAARATSLLQAAETAADSDSSRRRSLYVTGWLPVEAPELAPPIAACLCHDVASQLATASAAGRIVLGALLGHFGVDGARHGCPVEPIRLDPAAMTAVRQCFANAATGSLAGGFDSLPPDLLQAILRADRSKLATVLEDADADAARELRDSIAKRIAEQCAGAEVWLQHAVLEVVMEPGPHADATRVQAFDLAFDSPADVPEPFAARVFALRIATAAADRTDLSGAVAADCATGLLAELDSRSIAAPTTTRAIRELQSRVASGTIPLDSSSDGDLSEDVLAFLGGDLDYFLDRAPKIAESGAEPARSPAGTLSPTSKLIRRLSVVVVIGAAGLATIRYAVPALGALLASPGANAAATGAESEWAFDRRSWLASELGLESSALTEPDSAEVPVPSFTVESVPTALWEGRPGRDKRAVRATLFQSRIFAAQLGDALSDAWPGPRGRFDPVVVQLLDADWPDDPLALRPVRVRITLWGAADARDPEDAR